MPCARSYTVTSRDAARTAAATMNPSSDASGARLLDMALEDGAPRAPLSGLFPFHSSARRSMLLVTLLAFASVGGVTLPGVDPPALGGYRVGRTVVAPPLGDTTLKLLFLLSFVCNVVSGKRKRGVSYQTVSSDSDDDGDKTATIIGCVVGSIALTIICTWLKSSSGCCSSDNEEPSAPVALTPMSEVEREQTDPNAISVEMESASPSASVALTPMSEVEREQTDPNAISVEMESASPSASVALTPMSEVEREHYVRLFKSLGGCPVGRSEAAPTLERAQLPPDELDVIWELYGEHGQSVILAQARGRATATAAVDAWRPGPRGLTARYSRRQSVCTRANSGATRTLTGASMSRCSALRSH